MASLSVTSKTTSKIRVKITGLDTGWASGERYAHFYISANGYSTSSADYDGMLTLEEGIAESDVYSFTGLDAGTTYYISCVIKRGDTGSTIVTLKRTTTTEEEVILDLPYFSVSNITGSTAYVSVSNLANAFNASNYELVGVTTGSFTSQGSTSVPATIMGTKSAPASGTAKYTGFQVTGLKPGTTYKFYCFAKAANGKYYAISRSRTAAQYGISFTTLEAQRPADWTWTPAEQSALENSGTTDVITMQRWNAFIDRINEFSDYVRAKESSSMPKVPEEAKMSDGYLYASDFAQIAEVIDTVAGISAGYPLAPKKEDFVFGSYLIKMAEAINSIT